MSTDEDFDATVRASDPDRWLAARFIADPAARADVVLLYALNHELARVAEIVSEPMLGHIRLAWWREGLEEAAAGGAVLDHPVLKAMAGALASGAFSLEDLTALVDGRAGDLELHLLADDAALEAHLDATAVRLGAIAAKRLDATSSPEAVRAALRAWGLAGLHRARRLPPGRSEEEVVSRVEADLATSRAVLQALPVAAFPAVAYATFSRDYVRGREPGPLSRRLRLLKAVLAGRI